MFAFNQSGLHGYNCNNPTFPLYRYMIYFSRRIGACCKKGYRGDKNSAVDNCCLLSGQPCDSSVPCCNTLRCYDGRCPWSSGTTSDIAMGYHIRGNLGNTLTLPIIGNSSCGDDVFKYYGETDMKKETGCCKIPVKNAAETMQNCCLLGGSACKGQIACCRSTFCASGFCPELAGDDETKNLEASVNGCDSLVEF